jgi:hypothetical protein
VTVNAKMQPLVTLTESSPVSNVISPDDLTYTSDLENSFWEGTYYCNPCKEISVHPAVNRNTRLRVHWTGSIPLDLWAGQYYGSVMAAGEGTASEHDLVIEVPAGLDTVLVGLGKRNGVPQTLNQPVAFQLSIEPAQ